jgi:transposase
VRVLIATRPVDFRRGAEGLAATVQSVLRQDPFSGTIFVFRSKRADRVKMLVYDGTGLVLIWKRLEGSKFKWPSISDGVMRLSGRNWRRCSRGSIGGGCTPQGSDGRRWPAERLSLP